MKKVLSIIALATLILAACTPEPISEEQAFLSEEQVNKIIADDGGHLYTLNELIDTYMTEIGNFKSDSCLYRSRATKGDGVYLFSIDTLPQAGPGIYIRGRVITDDLGGNFYKAIVIQQIVNGEQQALRLSVDGSSAGGMYPLGQEILIRCNGLAIGRYADQPQLCVPSYNNNYTASNGEQKVGWAPGRIPWERFQLAVRRIGKPNVQAIHVDVVNLSDFVGIYANSQRKQIHHMDGRLVRVENIWFKGSYLDTNNKEQTCNTDDPDQSENANVFAPTTKNIGYPQSRVITDGNKISLVSNSEYAKFAYFYLPGADANGVANCPNYKGSVTGILGFYRDNARYDADFDCWSITMRDLKTPTRETIVSDLDLKDATGKAWIPVEYSKK